MQAVTWCVVEGELVEEMRVGVGERVLVLVEVIGVVSEEVGVAVEVEVVTVMKGVVEVVPVEKVVVVGLVVGVMVCTHSGLGRQQRTRIL